MKLKLVLGLALVLVPLVYLVSVQHQAAEKTVSGSKVATANDTSAKPDIGLLPVDEIPLNLNALPSGTAYGIAVPDRMITPQATYKMLNPELQDSLTAMVDTTPKFRKGGFRYEELSDDEKNNLKDRTDKPNSDSNKSLVSSISAGGQVTNSVNNGGFIFIPADPHGAAGPNQVVNVFNTSIEFYDKDGSNGSSRSLQSFFAPVSPLNFTFDPKVLYDQYEDRFVVVTLERQDTAGGDPDNTSRVLVAVSATSDPNGAWFMTAFDSEVFINGADRWFDYPGFAVDEEVVYLTGNMFGYGAAGGYGGVRLWMIDKTTFYNGSGATVIGPLDPFAGGGVELTSQPAHTYGVTPAGMGTYLMGYSRLSNGVEEFWQSIRIDNPTGAVSFTQSFVLIGDIEPPGAGALPSAPQSGTGLTVETNDPRALDAVWRDGQIFTSATIESNSQVGETSASWYVFDTSGGVAINDFGIIDGEDISAGTFTFFPSIAVNADGGIGVGFSASSSSIFPSSYFAMRSPFDAAGTIRGSQVIRPGTDFYHRTFGGTNRWGDYSSVAVDPNDACFWVYNKHAVGRSNGNASENGLYETAFGEFCNVAPSVGAETIAVDDGQIVTTLVGGAASVLANDTDTDAGDTLIAVLSIAPTEASAFNLNANGTFSYTHGGGNNASDAFTYNACDDGSPQECTSSQVNINITLSDTPPTAVSDSYTINEDSGTSVLDVTDNDTDLDGGPLNIIAVGSASNGTAVQSSNNINYTPSDDFCGADAFDYTLNGGSNTTVNLTVDCVNDDPVAVNDAASTNEDVLVSVAVLTGDSDVDTGDTLSVTSCTDASNGSVSRNGNNCEFTPAQDFNGQGSFNYAISDGQGGTASAAVTVTVNAVNDDPVAVNDAVSTNENTLVSVAVLAGDSDVDVGDVLSVTACTLPVNGTLERNGNNCEFTPTNGFNGQGGFNYAISDGNGGTDSASVTVTVNAVNDDPTAVNDTATTDEDVMVPVAVLNGDSDPDAGDTLSVTACTTAVNGSVLRNGDICEYTPTLNFNGQGGFSYAISDGNGGTDTATVTVTVNAVNDDPVAVNDAANTNEDVMVPVAVLVGDSDVDTSDSLSVTTCTAAVNGSVLRNGNNCEFTPNLNFNGQGGFSYAISDGNGGTDTATVTVTVNAVNDNPVAVNDAATTNEDVMVSVAVLAGDSDVDTGDSLSVTACTDAVDGSVLRNGNNCEFTPTLNFNGQGGFSYAISDGNGGTDTATVTVTVNAVNDNPTAVNDAATTDEDVMVPVVVLNGDFDVDAGDSLSVTDCSNASNGVVVRNANQCEFTPAQDFNGQGSFSYAISDGSGGTDTASVTVTVNAVNDAPVAVNDAVSTNENELVSVAVLAGDSDVDVGDVLSVTACTAPINGSLERNGNNCEFTPTNGFNGQGSFSYAISDGNGGTDTASVTVTVNAVNDNPTAVNDTATTDEDVMVSVAVLNGDSDPDVGDTLNVTSCSNANNGSVIRNGNNCEFTPAQDFNGQGFFSYAISDGNGGTDSAAVTVTVNAVNDDPVAADDVATTDEDTAVSVDVVAGDSDVDNGDILQPTSCTNATNGSVVLDGIFCAFTPALNFNGQASFEYTITDNEGGSDSASVTVTVNAVNDDPVAVNDAVTTNEDMMISVPVLAGDSDPDVGDTLSVTSCSAASNGSVSRNGNSCEFTPAPDFNGPGSFNYVINDGQGGSDSASVTVAVLSVNDEPSMAVNTDVYISLADSANPPAQNLACQFDFGPDNEDATESVTEMNVTVVSDSNNVLTGIDVDNTGALSYTFTGNAGVAELTVSLQDNGGIANGGDDTSPDYSFTVNVQDYVFRADFESVVCQ